MTKSHDLVDRVHPVNRFGELFGALEPVADLVDGAFYVRKNTDLKIFFEILQVGYRLVHRDRTARPFRTSETAFTLCTTCAQIRYPSSAGCTWEIRNRFPVLYSDSTGHFRRPRAAFHGQTDCIRCFGILHPGQQEISGFPVNLEFCPAVWIDDNFKERNDNFFLISVYHQFLLIA